VRDYAVRESGAAAHCRSWCRVVNDGLRQGRMPAHGSEPQKFGFGWFAVPAHDALLFRAVKLTHAQARTMTRNLNASGEV
jgi:hypothetical protein